MYQSNTANIDVVKFITVTLPFTIFNRTFFFYFEFTHGNLMQIKGLACFMILASMMTVI